MGEGDDDQCAYYGGTCATCILRRLWSLGLEGPSSCNLS